MLIRCYKVLGIPLLRRGAKFLEVDPAGIAMVIQLVPEARAQPQLSPHRLSA